MASPVPVDQPFLCRRYRSAALSLPTTDYRPTAISGPSSRTPLLRCKTCNALRNRRQRIARQHHRATLQNARMSESRRSAHDRNTHRRNRRHECTHHAPHFGTRLALDMRQRWPSGVLRRRPFAPTTLRVEVEVALTRGKEVEDKRLQASTSAVAEPAQKEFLDQSTLSQDSRLGPLLSSHDSTNRRPRWRGSPIR